MPATRCPYCGSDDVSHVSDTREGGVLKRRFVCGGCTVAYVVHYERVGVELATEATRRI